MIEIMIVVIIVGLLAAVGIPNLMHARVKSQRESCLNNLRQIDAAKQQWSIDNKKLKGYPVTISDISPYIRSGLPICPGQGNYTIGSVGTKPTCSVTDHVLD